MDDTHEKLRIALRYWLLGAGFTKAARALSFAEKFHTGTRKDGKTPEFAHQIWIASYLRTLAPSIDAPETTIAAALLHDTAEDADLGFEEIEALFGAEVAQAVRRLTKTHRGARVPDDAYYAGIAACPVASLVKGVDRVHNVGSMVGVFNVEKQISYMAEARQRVLPMLKTARETFTTQEPAYENIKGALEARLQLIEAMHRKVQPARSSRRRRRA